MLPGDTLFSMKIPQFHVKTFDELTLRELHSIYVMRALVFNVGQKITEQEPDDADLDCMHLFVKADDGRVIAYLRMFDLETVTDDSHEITPGAWTIGRVAVLPETRGTGLGKAIVAEGIRWISENTDAQRIEISAQQYLAGTLYAAAGFAQVGDVYLEAGIDHVHMVLELDR